MPRLRNRGPTSPNLQPGRFKTEGPREKHLKTILAPKVLGKTKSRSGEGEAIKPYQLINISHISRTYSLATEAKRTQGIGELITKDKSHLVTETEGLQRQRSPRHEGGNPACMQLRVTDKLHRQKGLDAPPRAALSGGTCNARTTDSDHLRWSPNFTVNTNTTPGTFFITRAKSKDGRKWPENTSKQFSPRRNFCSDLRRPAMV
ncbi:hypothetical protein M0R45_016041 [Rubus argutus]|uniref:Uncharacterized protein n=1 Tax=Rubus argutus TaxID=59490 RepID=A0AAW1XTU2_RUBAR